MSFFHVEVRTLQHYFITLHFRFCLSLVGISYLCFLDMLGAQRTLSHFPSSHYSMSMLGQFSGFMFGQFSGFLLFSYRPQSIRTSPGLGPDWTQILTMWFSCPTLDVVLYQVLRVSEQLCWESVCNVVLYQALQVSEQLCQEIVCNSMVLPHRRYKTFCVCYYLSGLCRQCVLVLYGLRVWFKHWCIVSVFASHRYCFCVATKTFCMLRGASGFL